MHDKGKPQFSLKFLLAPQLPILLADRRLLKENLNASKVLIKKADFYMTGKNPEYPKLIQTHRLESIVVAGLSCSYRRAVFINASGEFNTKITAFEDCLASI